MSKKLGKNCKLYRNTGTYDTPVWDLVPNVRDLTLPQERAEVEFTSRESGEFDEAVGSFIAAGIEFQMNFDEEDTDYVALETAFYANTPVDMAIMSGPITTAGSRGLRARFGVLKFSRTEPLRDGARMDVMIKPAPNSDGPAEWMIIEET